MTTSYIQWSKLTKPVCLTDSTCDFTCTILREIFTPYKKLTVEAGAKDMVSLALVTAKNANLINHAGILPNW